VVWCLYWYWFAVIELTKKWNSVRSMKIRHLLYEKAATKNYHTVSHSKLSSNRHSVWQRLPPNITTHYHGTSYPAAITLIGKDCCQKLSHIITVKVTQQPSLCLVKIATKHYYTLSRFKLSSSHHSDWQILLPKIITHYNSQSHWTAITLFGKECHQILPHIITVQVIQQPSLWLTKTAAKNYHTL
jgi:hypothetical protein